MYSPFFSSKLFQIVVYVLLCNTDIFRPRLSLGANSREMLSGRILLFVAVYDITDIIRDFIKA